jgi:alpha-1,6-mannosyltransferase
VVCSIGLGWGWLSTLDAGSARRSLLSVTTGVGVAVGAVGVAHVVGLAVAAVVAGVLLLRAERLGPLRALGLALLVIVVLSPTVQPWYLLWGLVVLAAVATEREVRALAAASAVLCLLVLPGGRHVIRPPLYGVPMLLVAAAAYAAWRSTPRTAETIATT